MNSTEESPTATRKIPPVLSLSERRLQLITEANEKTDEHLRKLMQECEDRHNQMLQYIENKNKAEEPKDFREFKGQLKDKLVLKSQSNLNLMPSQDQYSPGKIRDSDRRPPRI